MIKIPVFFVSFATIFFCPRYCPSRILKVTRLGNAFSLNTFLRKIKILRNIFNLASINNEAVMSHIFVCLGICKPFMSALIEY